MDSIEINGETYIRKASLPPAQAPIPDSPLAMPDKGHPYPVGAAVIIRTVTMYYTGRLVRVTERELVLVDAAWIGDTGYLSAALKDGTLVEIEPFPDGEVIVPREGSEVSRWAHPLPRSKK